MCRWLVELAKVLIEDPGKTAELLIATWYEHEREQLDTQPKYEIS